MKPGAGLRRVSRAVHGAGSGRPVFSEAEVRLRAKVVILGTTVVRELFGEENPLGETVRINRVNFTVIGVFPVKGSEGWRDWDDVAVVPVTTAMYRLTGARFVGSVDAEVAAAGLIEQAKIKAVAMTVSGGLAGIALGVGAAAVLARLAGWPVSLNVWALGLAAAFSVTVGLVFGLWPARQAAELDPIEALRYE